MDKDTAFRIAVKLAKKKGYTWQRSRDITASWGSAFRIVDSVTLEDGTRYYKLKLREDFKDEN